MALGGSRRLPDKSSLGFRYPLCRERVDSIGASRPGTAASPSSGPWIAGGPSVLVQPRISASGVLGDPSKADAAKGAKIWKLYIDHLVRFVEKLQMLSLDEIHERINGYKGSNSENNLTIGSMEDKM